MLAFAWLAGKCYVYTDKTEPMTQTLIGPNSVVLFHYTIRDVNSGEVIDSSQGRNEPILASMGMDELLPAIERELLGKSAGQSFKVVLPPQEAYGEYRKELVRQVERIHFGDLELEKGMWLQAQTHSGEVLDLRVVDFDEEWVTVDMNHPLAGRTLEFEITVVEVRD